MRSEQQMLDLILKVAQNDDNIRAVIMNGSRVNPNVPKDPFQDFDIVYFVREVEPYRKNLSFIEQLGELMILQTPEDMGDPPPENDGHYAYLLQFLDGNRIDLSFYALEKIPALTTDSLTVVLLDKDHVIPELPPEDRDYLPQPPTARQFDDCCNEFWWVNPYVAKGLWRDELPYTKYILDVYVRKQLMKCWSGMWAYKQILRNPPERRGSTSDNILTPTWGVFWKARTPARV